MGGKLLSKMYDGAMEKYEWEATWNNVKHHHSWCPNCKTSIRETVVRAAFRENFPGEDFATNRNVIGMELDGYSEKFSIALIRVPDRLVLPLKSIRQFVRNQLEWEWGYTDLPPKESLSEDKDFFANVRIARREKFQKYQEVISPILTQRGYTLLSDKIPSRTWPLQVKCDKDHEFTINVDHILRWRGCSECSPTRAKRPEEISDAVTARGYELVTFDRRKIGKKWRTCLTLRCKDHGEFEIQWDNFSQGKGCIHCGAARRGVQKRVTNLTDRLAPLVLEIEGEYTGNNKPTIFRCNQGHRFTSTLKKVEMSGAEKCCPPCVIAGYHMIECLDDYDLETDPAHTQFSWKCLYCEREFQATYRGMQIRKNLCKNKRCPRYD
jgi:hypothetical protein